MDHKVNFAPRQGNFLAYHTENTKRKQYLKLSADSGDAIDASFPILISPSGEDLYFQRSRTGAGIPFLPDGTDSVGLLLYTG